MAEHAELFGVGVGGDGGERVVDGVGEFGVAVDDEEGEQFVAARDVAVHRRGDDAEVAGDGAQRQGGGAVGGEMFAADPQDVGHRLLPGAGAGGSGHVVHLARFASTVNKSEHCS